MVLGILKEQSFENRVSVTPEIAAALLKMGFEKILVEEKAGENAGFPDEAYKEVGAVVATGDDIFKKSNLITTIHFLAGDQVKKLSEGQIILGQFNPLANKEVAEKLNGAKATAFSLDMLPRTTRAQAMDVLSSMATVAGYKAVLIAATQAPGFFPMFMTAAGTIKPAKVLIIGAGVAGLQAIATAKRLGAVVEAFDVRTAAKEEVLSLGARFVEVEGAQENAAAGGYAVEQSEDYKRKQAEAVHEHAKQADVIICTAQIPGRQAPVIVQKATVETMKPGSVIVDLAASTGGNCAVTENGKTIYHQGVCVIGDSNLPSTLPRDASSMFSKNILNFLKLLSPKGELQLNFDDDIIAATCIAHQGAVVSERLKAVLGKA
ncbi:MAG: Re/Si-specific NAD(P)(+) transhydrogenase subunit alpha [Lewinellaceae bacterium]|nr:Re/Si-specific NAD(P)(+) transhydrogenase subunit alpha [Saprospiraceae bacterium]MCB9341645.1 Re/Si-specific NAD(P)(+) transhydrogenase subunit alpha [Lewinellaceae bacterium]